MVTDRKAYSHEPLDIPLDPKDVSPEEWRAAQLQAAEIVRRVLWLGGGLPRMTIGGRPWNMARELSIWKRLASEHGPAQVNGAMTVAREALGIPTFNVFTMTIFNSKGKRHLLRQCIDFYERKQQKQGGAERVSSILKSILGSSK